MLWNVTPSVSPILEKDFVVPDTETLVQALDLDIPEMSAVRSALASQGAEAAAIRFVREFRAKPLADPILRPSLLYRVVGSEPRNPEFDTTRAEAYLGGRLFDGYLHWEAPGGVVDWRTAPLGCLTRFPFFQELLLAAHHTGDARYARAVIDFGRQYMEAWPIEEFAGHNTLERRPDVPCPTPPWLWGVVHNRLRAWCAGVHYLRTHPAIDDGEILEILRRMLEETRFLMWHIVDHVETGHNSGGTMLLSLAFVSALLSDFSESRAWRERLVHDFVRYLDAAFYPDGLFKELTTGYGNELARTVQHFALAWGDDPAMQPAHDRLRTVMAAVVGISCPDRHIPMLGDAWDETIASGVVPALADRMNLPWADARQLDAGKVVPPFRDWPPSAAGAWGGYYAMRSDWSPHARYLLVDGGPWGNSHMHCDRLSIVVSAFGHKFITDPGNTTYASDKPDALLTLLNAGFLHNTVTVDGVDEFIEAPGWWDTDRSLDNHWECGEDYVVFRGRFDFRPLREVTWERRILFVGGAYWLLQDLLTGAPEQVTVEQNFQFDPKIRVELNGTGVAGSASDGARLFLLPLDDLALKPELVRGEPGPHLTYSSAYVPYREPEQFAVGRGWVGRTGHRPLPATAVTWCGNVRLPAIRTLAIIPCAAGVEVAEPPPIRAVPESGGAIWELSHGERTWSLRATREVFEVVGIV